jgi:RNA polymerase sigma-70 factor (ECF subfamily)
MDLDDQQLIQRARDGDQAALTALCRRYEGTIRQYVYRRMPRRLRKRISVADIVQEALLTAVRRLEEDTQPLAVPFRAWLLRIADYKAREAARFHLDAAKRAMGAELSGPHRPALGALAAETTSPSRHAMAQESRAQVDAGLAALVPDHRAIIDLVHRRGFTMAEAGEHLGRSSDAARKLYARAVAALTRRLEADGADGSE